MVKKVSKGSEKVGKGKTPQTEKLKNKSVLSTSRNGGARPGAGRPKGVLNKATLEQKAVLEAFNQRVMGKVDELFHAQFSLAVGQAKVFRIDEVEEGNKVKRTHELVTDTAEIKALLDEHEGGAGVVKGKYYYITTTPPDNKAIDSLLNRTFGRPKETHEHSGEGGQPIPIAFIEAVRPKA